jgi:hypothetical protein
MFPVGISQDRLILEVSEQNKEVKHTLMRFSTGVSSQASCQLPNSCFIHQPPPIYLLLTCAPKGLTKVLHCVCVTGMIYVINLPIDKGPRRRIIPHRVLAMLKV